MEKLKAGKLSNNDDNMKEFMDTYRSMIDDSPIEIMIFSKNNNHFAMAIRILDLRYRSELRLRTMPWVLESLALIAKGISL